LVLIPFSEYFMALSLLRLSDLNEKDKIQE
jgi:hypothetical protein